MHPRIHRIRKVQRLARMAQAQPLASGPQAGPGRGQTKKPKEHTPGWRGGNSLAYLARKVARDHPAILQRMLAGEYEYAAWAFQDAGLQQRTSRKKGPRPAAPGACAHDRAMPPAPQRHAGAPDPVAGGQ